MKLSLKITSIDRTECLSKANLALVVGSLPVSSRKWYVNILTPAIETLVIAWLRFDHGETVLSPGECHDYWKWKKYQRCDLD